MKPVVLVWLFLVASPVWAWHSEGHVRTVDLAVDILGDRVPAFLAEGKALIGHCSVDPDTFKFRAGTGLLRDREYPEHFFDLELFTDTNLPDDRLDFFFWCLRNDVYIQKIGTLPYALGEATEKLSIVFAEHRRWPENEAIQTKCLVYAGHLAHYAADLGQPLHTTIHHDGRVAPGGTSPRTGIHDKVDALLGKLDIHQQPPLSANTLAVYENLLSDILTEIRASNRRVDRVYDLESQLPANDDNTMLHPNSPVGQLGRDLWAASARITANLILTAWEMSKEVSLPDWLER